MHYLDLKRSNAIYIFRSIMDSPKTLLEISNETEIAEITVKKIIYKLVDESIVSKAKDYKPSVGRPKLYLTPNSINHCVLIIKDGSKFIFYSINSNGESKELFQSQIDTQLLSESGSLQMAFQTFKQSPIYNHCHDVFLIGNDIDSIDVPECIEKITPFDLVIKSLIQEERTIYVEFDNKKALINYGKVKLVDCSLDDIEKIIQIDTKYLLNELDLYTVLIEAIRIITLKNLEEKIAKLF